MGTTDSNFLRLSMCGALALGLAACDSGGVPEDAGAPDASTAPADASTDAGDHDSGLDAAVNELDAGPEPAPVFRNPVDLEDTALATEALRLMGAAPAGGHGSCSGCHGITRQQIRDWHSLSQAAFSSCFTDLEPATQEDAMAVVDCLRGTGDIPYHPTNIGVFSTAARLPWFAYIFRRAYGESWLEEYFAFTRRAEMPPMRTPFRQGEFDIIAEWFLRGVPELETALSVDPAPTECTPWISPAVSSHVSEMALAGWAATNEANGILMHGCAGTTDPRDCLAAAPLASESAIGAGWDVIPGAKTRLLHTTSYRSAFWTRSSADGRFVGHGGGPSGGGRSSIIDLQDDRVIGVDASYDPGFFPDNSGFMFMGGGGVCEQNVLTTGAPTEITFDEPQCSSNSMVGLYEHVGASLDGGDYWAVHGQFTSDNGGHSRTRTDPRAGFTRSAITELTRMINVGAGFEQDRTFAFNTPYEGDAAISPSSRLLVSRLGDPEGKQLGFVLRRIETTRDGDGITITMPEIARYCLTGGKPAFSYDERWLITHHYVGDNDADAIELGFTGADDPGYLPYRTEGAANVYVVDLRTGEKTRLTHMQPGQYALFPHFRSDGWIYFIVRTAGGSYEHVAATDAAYFLSAP